MIFLIRYCLASTLFHLFEGITFGAWASVLRHERFRISPWRWPRALWITSISPWNSWAARATQRRFGAAVAATRVVAPVFILGHYRSGTTHLHELLALDARFASPNRFQTFNPSTFLTTERWLAPLVEPFMLPRRVQEDEIAYLILTGLSPYMDWVFPRSPLGYARTLSFRAADPAEAAAWSRALADFLKALTLKTGRPLILKSPPHTARVRLILSVFPDARFIHIRRDPYTVFLSTIGLLKAVRPIFRLQEGPRAVDEGAVLRGYQEMYDAYFDDRALVPPGRLIEVAYEDLTRDPIGQVRAIYEGLALAEFAPLLPALEAHLASVAGHRPARHPELDIAARRRVAVAAARCFAEWGYPR